MQLLQKSGTHLDPAGHCKSTRAHGFFSRHSNVFGQLFTGRFGTKKEFKHMIRIIKSLLQVKMI